jgi:hypothetical protein
MGAKRRPAVIFEKNAKSRREAADAASRRRFLYT